MTKIKLCGMSREEDILTVNELMPDYIGFVFAQKSTRYVSPDRARALRAMLHKDIQAVGVFAGADVAFVAELLNSGVIDLAQLHGGQGAADVTALRRLTGKPIIQAFKVEGEADITRAQESPADMVLMDHGAGGTGQAFDWDLLRGMRRPYLLAGGLDAANVAGAIAQLAPWAVDVSSGIETNGVKDPAKMRAFVANVKCAT